jgi:chromosome segregation ATPase
MYNKEELSTLKGFAESTILHMTQLVKALDTVETIGEENDNLRNMSNQLATDLQHAQSRIEEDEVTINIKDGQLKEAQNKITDLESTHSELSKRYEQTKSTCETYESSITNLQNELKSYKDQK